jgi:hypothetical protein
MEAHMGDLARLERFRASVADRPKALAQLYWVYADLMKHDQGVLLVETAYAAAPADDAIATAMCEAEISRGDVSAARRVAERLTRDRPYAHAGFERLALVSAMELDAETALAASARAVESAPSCAVAQRARAAALFAAGDREGAAARARYALALDAPNTNREARWEVGFLAALDGKSDALDPYLARLSDQAAERRAPYLSRLRTAPSAPASPTPE